MYLKIPISPVRTPNCWRGAGILQLGLGLGLVLGLGLELDLEFQDFKM